jgi:hypothetical protein
MPFPPKLDAVVRQRFDEIITDAENLLPIIAKDNRDYHQRNRDSRIQYMGEVHYRYANIIEIKVKAVTLIELVLVGNERAKQFVESINNSSGSSALELIRGTLRGLKNDYESGLLDDLPQMIETNISYDYMGQAEQLLGEGVAGQYDYVPAAVLAGAVLEDALRRLCQRQTPPIDTLKPNGDKKTLDPLITDLQRVNVFNTAKADQLRSWAKIRNYAAHGEFAEFNRAEVEAMIAGIKTFIADYL